MNCNTTQELGLNIFLFVFTLFTLFPGWDIWLPRDCAIPTYSQHGRSNGMSFLDYQSSDNVLKNKTYNKFCQKVYF